jgi:hypothetical protein
MFTMLRSKVINWILKTPEMAKILGAMSHNITEIIKRKVDYTDLYITTGGTLKLNKKALQEVNDLGDEIKEMEKKMVLDGVNGAEAPKEEE